MHSRKCAPRYTEQNEAVTPLDTFKNIFAWLMIAAAASPVWGPLFYVLWQYLIRPYLIPAADIARLAADLRARHGERAAEAAYGGEYDAWRDSDIFAQGTWRRVRRLIERKRG